MSYEIYQKQLGEWKKVAEKGNKVAVATTPSAGSPNARCITVDGQPYNIPEGSEGSYLPLAGGTMTGDITFLKASSQIKMKGSSGKLLHQIGTMDNNSISMDESDMILQHIPSIGAGSGGPTVQLGNDGKVMIMGTDAMGLESKVLTVSNTGVTVDGSKVLDKLDVIDNVVTSYSDMPLSAKQGVYLNNRIEDQIPKTSIVDNLTTDVSTKVLSAKQGKVLKDIVDLLPKTLFDIIYPVGITYVQHTADDAPSSIFAYGTWEDITSSVVSSGCRYPAFSPNEIGTKLDQELPNIRGEMNATPCAASGVIGNGAFGESGKWSDYGCGYGNNYANGHYIFNANQSNTIYKDGGKVQPYTYTVKLWKRVS